MDGVRRRRLRGVNEGAARAIPIGGRAVFGSSAARSRARGMSAGGTGANGRVRVQWRAMRPGNDGIDGKDGLLESVSYRIGCWRKASNPSLSANFRLLVSLGIPVS